MATNEDRIRKRAYEIWEREGQPHGDDMKHWLQAFEDIAASSETGAGVAKKHRSSKAKAVDAAVKAKPAAKAGGGARSVPTTTPPPKATKASGSVTKH